VGARTKAAKGREAAARLPADAELLLELMLAEIRAPVDTQKILDALPPVETCFEEARRLLKAKDRATRRAAFIENERLWFNKYGWFMARVVGLFGLLAFALFLSTRGAGVDFFSALLLGAAGYYLLLVTLSNLRYRDGNRKRRRLREFEADRYQREVVQTAAALLKRFGAAPESYPVESPRTPAGLEQREEGYFIPAARD
jgi:hypothetical protein